jgi:hypothetical protein
MWAALESSTRVPNFRLKSRRLKAFGLEVRVPIVRRVRAQSVLNRRGTTEKLGAGIPVMDSTTNEAM